MSRGVNKVILVGNVGKDPETRYTPSGVAVTNFSLATTETWKDKNTGERQDRTEWHNIVIFGNLAEIAAEYVTKGKQLYVEGGLTTEKWQDKSGNDRYTTKIKVIEMQILGGKPNNQQSSNQNQNQQQQPANSGSDVGDDDIPF